MNNNNDNILRKTNLPNIIGLSGLKGSGKDACAEYFVDKGYVNCKFAAPLKDMLRCLLGNCGYTLEQIEEMIEGQSKNVKIPSMGWKTTRELMQTLGTEWGRDLICPAIWTNFMVANFRQYEKVIITDLRFPNEMEIIKSFGGCTVKIIRPNTVSTDSHCSENLLDGFQCDYEVLNGSTIRTLQRTTLKCCEHFQATRGEA